MDLPTSARFRPVASAAGALARPAVEAVLRPGRRTQAELGLVRGAGAGPVDGDSGLAVLKDYAAAGWLFRAIVARWLIAHEASIYLRLQGLPGIPRIYGRVGPLALLRQYIPGLDAGRFHPGELPDSFFAEVAGLVEAMHRRGVVHCDLRNCRNILVAEGPRPYLVDFAAAFSRGWSLDLPRAWLHWMFHQADLTAVAKLKRRLAPHLLTAADRRALTRMGPVERVARALRDLLRLLAERAAR